MFIGSGVQIGGGVQVISEFTGIVTSGLQVNLLTAPSSGTTWTDVQGGYNATLQGTPTYVSNNGGGIRLNNSTASSGTDYISLPYNISSSTATVELVASFSPTSHWATVWGNEVYNTGAGYIAYMTSSTGITWGDGNGSTTTNITASNSIRHWTFVIDSTNLLLYLNGSQLGSTIVITAQTSFATSDFYFGARHQNAGGGPATDKMNNSTAANYPVFYQMRVYNKALNAAEVTQNYTAIRGTYGI